MSRQWIMIGCLVLFVIIILKFFPHINFVGNNTFGNMMPKTAIKTTP